MGDVVQFKRVSPMVKHKGNTLCKSGFHKWLIKKNQVFDVKQGKLVTTYECSRCSALKNEAK